MIMHLNEMSIFWNYWLSNVLNSYGILIPNQVSLRKWYVAPNNIKTFLRGPKKCRQVICYDVYFLSLSETILCFMQDFILTHILVDYSYTESLLWFLMQNLSKGIVTQNFLSLQDIFQKLKEIQILSRQVN